MGKNLVYGVGINDVDYKVFLHDYVDGVRKVVWSCPYYGTWTKMLKRCYDKNLHNTHPTYTDCVVEESWHYFSNFRKWMDSQNWLDDFGRKLHLDKDIMVIGNKVYSEGTCMFVNNMVNNLFQSHTPSNFLEGVTLPKDKNKFKAQCRDPLGVYKKHIGYFEDEVSAHVAYLERKIQVIYNVAAVQDPIVKTCLYRWIALYNDKLQATKRLMS